MTAAFSDYVILAAQKRFSRNCFFCFLCAGVHVAE